MTAPDYSPAADRNKQAILEVLLKEELRKNWGQTPIVF